MSFTQIGTFGNAVAERPIYLTREQEVFKLHFSFSINLVERCKNLPYSRFDPETKSWACLVCMQSVEELRKMFYEGLTDVSVDSLLEENEELVVCKPAILRPGSTRRPFLVSTAFRDDRLFSRLRAIPGAQWVKNSGAMSYGPLATSALLELTERGVLDDPGKLLSPSDVVINYDTRNGTFLVKGDPRAKEAFLKHWPEKDVYAGWKNKGIDVTFSDNFTEEMYKGEWARNNNGADLNIEGLKIELFAYQKANVAIGLERSGLGVFDAPGLGKCLHPNSLVWVNGNVKKIEDIFKENFKESTFDGEGYWVNAKNTLKVYSLNSQNKLILSTVSRLYKQKVAEKLIKITCDNGESILITKKHHLLTKKQGWSTHLEIGDSIAGAFRIKKEENNLEVKQNYLFDPKAQSLAKELMQSDAIDAADFLKKYANKIQENSADINNVIKNQLNILSCHSKALTKSTLEEQNDIKWLVIKDISEVFYEGWVYDLEVPIYHNFIAEGILCHNTATGIAWALETVINRKEAPRALVIVPGAVRTQWAREIERFTGCTDIVVIDGDKKKRYAGYEKAKESRWMVVNYDVLHLDYKLIAPLASGALIIADEAHKCFTGDTQILTENGKEKIEDLVLQKKKTKVITWNEKRQAFELRKINAYMQNEAPAELLKVTHGGGEFICTANHPIWTEEKGFIKASDLHKNQHVKTIGTSSIIEDDTTPQLLAKRLSTCSSLQKIIKIEKLQNKNKEIAPYVYNLEVDTDNNYIANGVLVHNCKNPAAKRTKALHNLNNRAYKRMALTGTPVENDPGEWYAILNGIVAPGVFGSPTDFLSRYSYPGQFGGYEGARNLPELRERSKPLYVRHTKAQVATHLPPLRVQHLPLDPDTAYASALKKAHKEARDEIKDARAERLVRKGVPLNDEEWDEIGTGSEMTAVGMLRLMCSSPRLLAESTSESAKALIKSGLVPDSDGPKLDELRTMAIEMQSSGDRMVVFTFSKKMATLITKRLDEDGVRNVSFTGDTSSKKRDEAVLAFTTPSTSSEPGPTVFVATDAAAEGLNLGKCCATLVNFDMPWTPAKAIQRSNRIHRLDGTHPKYLVINLTLKGTLEEGILKMLEVKADLQDALFGEQGGRKNTTGRAGRSIFEEILEEWE